MQRTTIMLPETLKIKAMQVASKRGVSLGELIRESLRNSCANKKTTQRDPFFADTAVYDGKVPTNLASDHDDYLYDDKT